MNSRINNSALPVLGCAKCDKNQSSVCNVPWEFAIAIMPTNSHRYISAFAILPISGCL